MAEGERKSGWRAVVCCLVLLPVLYWMSAPVTLWAWWKCEGSPREFIYGVEVLTQGPPKWWCSIYSPVLLAAEQPALYTVTMKPFEWADVDGLVSRALIDRDPEALEGIWLDLDGFSNTAQNPQKPP